MPDCWTVVEVPVLVPVIGLVLVLVDVSVPKPPKTDFFSDMAAPKRPVTGLCSEEDIPKPPDKGFCSDEPVLNALVIGFCSDMAAPKRPETGLCSDGAVPKPPDTGFCLDRLTLDRVPEAAGEALADSSTVGGLGSAAFVAFARISKILFREKAHRPTSGRLQGGNGLGYSDGVSVD